jgi:uncharacterized protein involved in copper resistance
MTTRTRTLGAIGATVVTAGLAVGLAFGGNSAATSDTTTTSAPMPMGQMPGMDSMMSGDMDDMAAMMGSADMSAMHSMMHQMMKGTVDDDVLAACDAAHAAMADQMVTMPAQGGSRHDAHHPRAQS